MSSATPAPSTTADPWDRFGWLMGSIWLVFLVFTLGNLITSDELPMAWRVLGVLGILIFAAVYIRGFVVIGHAEDWGAVKRAGLQHLGVLLAITLLLAPGLGVGTLALLPYLVALSMFSLPLKWAFAVAGGALVVCLVVPLTLGQLEEFWFFILIVGLVAVSTGLVRVLEQRGDAHRVAESELRLAAERDRVARDVHDVLGHSLTVVTIKAELAQRLLETDPARAHDELDQIQALSRAALAEIRATVAGLRVASLAGEVTAAASALADAGIAAQLPDDLDVVDPRHRVILAWVLREAVTNVVRHSHATTCRVELEPAGLRVTDNGRGLSGTKEGNGLRGVRERLSTAGGTLTLTPGADGGTVLDVSLAEHCPTPEVVP